ncbi:MAG: DUF167 domain-containing protein [Deltaproteobacteria bacterium]|nr:DUF167 domain-containing protein [Deltaproteobacteria bacterium]
MILRETADGVILNIHVIPRSSKCGLAGIRADALKLKITSPPVEGRANDECIRLLADTFSVSRSRITIISGHRSRTKKVAISGIGKKDIESALAAQ